MATWASTANKQQTTIVAGPSNSQTLTLGTPAAHSVLIVLVVWTGASITVSVSGGTGNVWASDTQMTNGTQHCQIWYCLDAHNVATTVTVSLSGAGGTNIQIFDAEYTVSGTATQSTVVAGVDAHINTATGSSTTPASGAVQATYENELWICYAGWPASDSLGGTAPYTLNSSSPAEGLIEHNLNTANALAAAGACGTTGSHAWMCGVITFYITSVGTVGLTSGNPPSISATAGQGVLMCGTPERFSVNTDPMGATGTGTGPNKVGQIYPTGRA